MRLTLAYDRIAAAFSPVPDPVDDLRDVESVEQALTELARVQCDRLAHASSN